jgi:4-hydroxy-tetrahydrodipicolinate synthase
MQPFDINGIVPVIPTPFTAEDEVQWDALGGLFDFAIETGACAICLPAYASEFYKLSEEERNCLVERAVGYPGQRLPVIAQVNDPSASGAAACAAKYQEIGAAAIAAAVPRLFPLAERDLYRYFDRILRAIDIPLIIQDFHPGGPTISASFIASLHRTHGHFRYVKLEETMMAAKVERIIDETGGGVGVLEGWGGMYLLELLPAGIAGVVSGLAIADLLARVYCLGRTGHSDEAFYIFQGVLPQVVYSLQNLELFHHAEKSLLKARGVLANANVREARLHLYPGEEAHLAFLNRKVLELLDELGLPHNPADPGSDVARRRLPRLRPHTRRAG